MDAALTDLRAALGADGVVTDPDILAAHLVDWTGRHHGSAAAMVRPSSTAEVVALVEVARRHGFPLVAQGGNTGLVGGSIPGRDPRSVVVHLGRLDAVTDRDADAGQLTAHAGVTLAAVQREADAMGWRYAVDLAARDSATIGGTIATNAGGLRVLRHGMTRRHVLGIEAVLGTGEVVSHLGGLVKDNTGYDLAGLLCGSEGTLGIVTAARLALVPASTSSVTALIGLPSVEAAIDLVAALRRAVPTLEVVEVVLAGGMELVARHRGDPTVFDPVPPVALLVEAVGPPDPADDLAAVIDAAHGVTDVAVATDDTRARRLWQVREAHTEAIAAVGSVRKYDVTVPLGAMARFLHDVPGLVRDVDPDATTWLFGHLGDGNIHVNVTGGAAPGDGASGEATSDLTRDAIGDAVLSRVVADGGSVSAEHGIGRVKRAWLEASRSPAEVRTMRALKEALDPAGILNPGVLLGP